MSQHDFDITNQSFPNFRTDLNNALKALASNNSGATAPTTTYAGLLWFDSTNNILNIRDPANTSWIQIGYLDGTNGTWAIDVSKTTAAFRVTQRGTGVAIQVEDTTTPDSTPFVVDNNGDVGIGTSTVTFNAAGKGIHVTGVNNPGIRLQSATGGGSDLELLAGTAIADIRQVANLPIRVLTNNAEIWRWNAVGAVSLGSAGSNWGSTNQALISNGNTAAVGWGPIIDSGNYTPTLTNVTNIAASTAISCQWLRVGNTVTVSGQFSASFTAAATNSEIGLSLPVASNLSAGSQLGGTATPTSATLLTESAAILGDATNDRAQIILRPSTTATRTHTFTFTYRII